MAIGMQEMQTHTSQPKDRQVEMMRQKVRIAELASRDPRLTPETCEKNRKAAEMGKMALMLIEED